MSDDNCYFIAKKRKTLGKYSVNELHGYDISQKLQTLLG